MPTIIIRNAHVSIWSCFFCNCNFNFFFFSLRCVTLFSKRWALSQLASSPSCSVSNARPTRSVGGGSTHTAHSHSPGSCNIKNIVKMRSWHQFVAKQIQSTKLHPVGIQENISPCLPLPRRQASGNEPVPRAPMLGKLLKAAITQIRHLELGGELHYADPIDLGESKSPILPQTLTRNPRARTNQIRITYLHGDERACGWHAWGAHPRGLTARAPERCLSCAAGAVAKRGTREEVHREVEETEWASG